VSDQSLREAASFNKMLDRMTRSAITSLFQVGRYWRVRHQVSFTLGASTRIVSPEPIADKLSNNMPTIASDLLQRHIETLVDDAAEWETLIADDIVWELAYAPSVGHPARLSGREEVIRHVTWFRGAVDNFRFFNLTIHPFEDSAGAVAEVEAEGVIKPTGRVYRQNYVVFLRTAGGKIVFLREYFDPVRAAKAMDLPIAV
jgi:ketosteroid isomerase-like protein